MTLEEEEALFERRVKQINRDCLATFMPYIKAVISILLTVGIGFLGLTIHFYQTAAEKMEIISQTTIHNTSAIMIMKTQQDDLGKSVLELQRVITKKKN